MGDQVTDISQIGSLDDSAFLEQSAGGFTEVVEPSSTNGTNTPEPSNSNQGIPNSVGTTESSATDANNSGSSEPTGDDESDEEGYSVELPEDFDYKDAYLSLTKPFKADGKLVVIKNPEEAKTLMQKGIGFTSKSQKLAGQAKLGEMLVRNGIKDEDVPFLIDLHKRNPNAIQKYLRESQIDPLDVDISSEPNYTPNDYSISEQERAFTETVDNITQTPKGIEFIKTVQEWDAESKGTIWSSPDVLPVLAEHYQNGTYKIITNEITRRRMLGLIPENSPFLSTYQSVGHALLAERETQSKSANGTEGSNVNAQSNVVKRVVTPKATVTNNSAVSRANTGRVGGKPAAVPDYSQLSDAEFLQLKL